MFFTELVFVWNALVSYHLFILLFRNRRSTIRSFEQIKESLERKILVIEQDEKILTIETTISTQSLIDSQLQAELRDASEKKDNEEQQPKSQRTYKTTLLKTPFRPANQYGLRKLQTLLGLPCDPSTILIPRIGKPSYDDPNILDAIFVSIDLGYFGCKYRGPHVREVGLSTLDTRDLFQRYGCTDERSLISTQHYLTEPSRIPFGFGTSMYCAREDIIDILKRLFYMDEGRHHEVRNIVFVGYDTQVEIKTLKHLGIDLRQAPSIVDVFDTGLLGIEVFRTLSTSKLKDVVTKVGIEHQEDFYNAGNGANYTLRAMLRLATYIYKPGVLNRNQRLMVEMYHKISV